MRLTLSLGTLFLIPIVFLCDFSMHLDRTALDSLFSRASQWPSDGDWNRLQRDAAEQLGEHLIEHPKTGMLMVLVPAGKFLSGYPHYPRLEVNLPAYYVAVHPVTNTQYARFVTETGHPTHQDQVWQDNHPVTNVSWEDAIAYCRWAELRLPTELEWEKAARGLDGRSYPWGKNWNPHRCRTYLNKGSETTACVWRYGQGGAPFGGLQFSGNVWEWCADSFDSSGSTRVLRGGSWRNVDPGRFSVFSCCKFSPDIFDSRYGFRCVL